MTEEERRALPWYGGNKIPESYLAKFMPKTEHDDMPYELRLFLSGMTGTKKEQTNGNDYDF